MVIFLLSISWTLLSLWRHIRDLRWALLSSHVAKKKTHPKRTQKAGTPGNRLHKGIGEFLIQPKLHELGQPIVVRDEVDDTVESVSDDACDEDSRQSLSSLPRRST